MNCSGICLHFLFYYCMEKAKDLYTLMFILKQMQQEVVNFQESQNTAVQQLSKLLTEKVNLTFKAALYKNLY